MKTPTVGSLFSGIGGLDLGLDQAGFRPLWFCEKSAFCRRALAKHWPGVKCYRDAQNLPDPLPERVDLIAGGFPCQPVSQARALHGGPQGEKDPRWGWPWMLRWITELSPDYVLIENVPGLLFERHGRLGDRIRSDLERSGYRTDRWERIPAGGFGALHLRVRVFLFAYSDRVPLECFGLLREMGQAARSRAKTPPQWERIRSGPGYRLASPRRAGARGSFWVSEPKIRRMVDGVPFRVVGRDLAALGNSVPPPVAKAIGQILISAMEANRERSQAV